MKEKLLPNKKIREKIEKNLEPSYKHFKPSSQFMERATEYFDESKAKARFDDQEFVILTDEDDIIDESFEEILGLKLAKIKSKDIDDSFELIKKIKGIPSC